MTKEAMYVRLFGSLQRKVSLYRKDLRESEKEKYLEDYENRATKTNVRNGWFLCADEGQPYASCAENLLCR